MTPVGVPRPRNLLSCLCLLAEPDPPEGTAPLLQGFVLSALLLFQELEDKAEV